MGFHGLEDEAIVDVFIGPYYCILVWVI